MAIGDFAGTGTIQIVFGIGYGDETEAVAESGAVSDAYMRTSTLSSDFPNNLQPTRGDCSGFGGTTTVDYATARAVLNGDQPDNPSGETTEGAVVNSDMTSEGCLPYAQVAMETLGIVYYDDTGQPGETKPYFCGMGHDASVVANDPCDVSGAFAGIASAARTEAGCECWDVPPSPPPPRYDVCGSAIYEMDTTSGVCAGDAWPGCVVADLREQDFVANNVCKALQTRTARHTYISQ